MKDRRGEERSRKEVVRKEKKRRRERYHTLVSPGAGEAILESPWFGVSRNERLEPTRPSRMGVPCLSSPGGAGPYLSVRKHT